MKILLAIAFMLVVAGGALAQTPYNYAGCVYRLGVFFSDDPNDFEVGGAPWDEVAYYTYTPFVTFYMHLVAIDCPEMISAYEMNMSALPASMVVNWHPIPGSGWINIGTIYNHICGFGFPQPNPGGVTHLGRWSIVAQTGGVPANVFIGPASPSSIGGDGPAIVVYPELWRTNFTPWEFSGCYWDLPPDPTPILVGNIFGGVVATETMSLTSVKALFK